MDSTLSFIFSLTLIALTGTYFWYTSLIKKRNKVLEALSGIDVQLKKRAELIPNILVTAKKFMDHERSLFEEVTKLRENIGSDYDKGDPQAVKQHLQTAGKLSGKMGELFVKVENYPNLKSDVHILHAQRTYNETEEHIAAARRFYNAAINSLKDSVQIFPGNLIATVAQVKELPFYETDEESRKPVNAIDHL